MIFKWFEHKIPFPLRVGHSFSDGLSLSKPVLRPLEGGRNGHNIRAHILRPSRRHEAMAGKQDERISMGYSFVKDMLHRACLLFLFLLFFSSTLYPCRWCFDGRVETLIQSQLVPPSGSYLPADQGKEFYKECVYDYYPKAYVIRDVYFPTMCPAAIDVALREVVNVLTHETWFYFTNDREHFRWSAHWERILTVGKILQKFLERSIVYLDDYSVYKRSFQEYIFDDSAKSKRRPTQELISYFKEHGFIAFYDFYALYFDYHLKLFNEGIKFHSRDKMNDAYYQLQSIASHLEGSKYQACYEVALTTCKRLRKLFRKQIEDRQPRQKGIQHAIRSYGVNTEKYDSSSPTSFIESFVRHYDFHKQGRYTHEYHPFLLRRTAASMDTLEQRLENEGFSLHGRMIIAGYEEQAVPSYYTDFSKPTIDDESLNSTKVGGVAPPHNRFGLMTGFLFKDFNYFAKKWFVENKSQFTHINPDKVEIFDKRAKIFQQDAFGELYDLLLVYQEKIEEKFFHDDAKGILKDLVDVWQTIYTLESRGGGNHIIGTQDILFSIEYARRLSKSPLPIMNYFTGADITYPIEVSVAHNKQVTRNAQDFVQVLHPQLTPVRGEKTAYVFCSFVDGVGKSTTLGNIKNFTQFGADIAKYQHVDNSSSQLAQIHVVSDSVVIADLPAQVSLFTYKPDGFVYVDLDATTLESLNVKELMQHIRANKEQLIRKFYELFEDVLAMVEKNGFFAAALNDMHYPEQAFIKNLIVLKQVFTNTWVPFSFKENHYIFNFENPAQIRLLQPLANAQSHGLKNADSAQMLFLKGVRFPLLYKIFLDDLTKKLHDQGVRHIVFVDFLSMYPRSCRENVRVNYMLQQLALLHPDFEQQKSLYTHFVDDIHLFHLLKSGSYDSIRSAFRKETAVRLALFTILEELDRDTLDGISLGRLTKMIQSRISQEHDYIKKVVKEKMTSELAHLEDLYGLSKPYVNVHQFSFSAAKAFSEYLEKLFTKGIENKRINALWDGFDKSTVVQFDEAHNYAKLDNKLDVQVKQHFAPGANNRIALEPFFRTLRANWYACLANILGAKGRKENRLQLKKECFPVVPLSLKMDSNGTSYLVQKKLPLTKKDLPEKASKLLENVISTFYLDQDGMHYGIFGNKFYPLDWNINATHFGLYAFDSHHSLFKEFDWTDEDDVFSSLVRKYHKQYGDTNVMPTSVLYSQLCKSKIWKKQFKELLERAFKQETKRRKKKKSAKKNTQDDKKQKTDKLTKNSENQDGEEEEKIKLGGKEHVLAARVVVRALATLEMIVKDPDADIVVRRGNKKDFKAALKLFERVTLPRYFKIIFPQPLFDDYDKVQPCVSWDIVKQR